MQGGRLVPDDVWRHALVRLAETPRERRKLATHDPGPSSAQLARERAHLLGGYLVDVDYVAAQQRLWRRRSVSGVVHELVPTTARDRHHRLVGAVVGVRDQDC